MSKSNIKRRLTLLYVIFFVVIAAAIVLTFTSNSFGTGFNDADRIINVVAQQQSGTEVRCFFDNRLRTEDIGFDTTLATAPDGSLTVSGRNSTYDVMVVADRGLFDWRTSVSYLFVGLAFAIYIAIFALLFVILTSLRRSIKNEDVFARRNIRRTRIIGAMLILASLMASTSAYLDTRFVADILAQSDLQFDTTFGFNFGEIVTGIMIFCFAEIFSIGYDLSEEQKLTI